MKHLVLGYAMNASLPQFTREDVCKLTHINLAFGLIKDGLLDMSRLTNIALTEKFRKWNPEIKIVLSVGGWGAGGFSEMAMTEEGRWNFARSCRAAVDEYNLDGIDIDWEYPCSKLAGIGADSRDRENFTSLMRSLRGQLGRKIVSIAAGAGDYFVRDTQMDKVARIVDYVQIMTYDMRSGFCTQAGHHASLCASHGDTSNLNTKEMVRLFIKSGVPAEKIVIGAAFYSRRWIGVPDEDNGMLKQAQSVGMSGPRYSEITDDFIIQNGFEQYWDADAQAAYLWNGKEFISYETPEAIRLKCTYVKDQKLLGIMYWEHGCDTTGELLDAIESVMHTSNREEK